MSRKKPHNALSEEAYQKIHAALVSGGMTFDAMSKTLGISRSTIQEYKKRNIDQINADRAEIGLGAIGKHGKGRSRKPNSFAPDMSSLVKGVEDLFQRIVSTDDDEERESLAKAATACRGLVDSLYKIHRLEAGEATSVSKSEREVSSTTKVVTVSAPASNPLRVLRNKTG